MLFIALLVSFINHYRKHRRHWQGHPALLADAAMAGLLLWLPTLLIGTPIIEFRTMLLLGMTLALPYLCIPREQRPRSPISPLRSLYAAA